MLARTSLRKDVSIRTGTHLVPMPKSSHNYFSPEEGFDGTLNSPTFSWNIGNISISGAGENGKPIGPRWRASLPFPWPMQAKLEVGAVDDPLEHEADRVAEQVMRMREPTAAAQAALPGAAPEARRECSCGGGCDKCNAQRSNDEHGPLQMKPAVANPSTHSSAPLGAPPIVHEVLRSVGQPLDATTRSYFEPRFGHDFSGVRIHADAAAEESARELNARAYTVRHNIVFGAGRFAPGTEEGRRLLAHELTHVIQQSVSSNFAPVHADDLLQRKVILKGSELKNGSAFIKARKWADVSQAQSIMDDMAAAGDVFDFANEKELELEIVKRSSTVKHMEESQANFDTRGAFAYPFSEKDRTELYGPRVNYAAREYWEPPVSDNYADRATKANSKRNAVLRQTARSSRFSAYGDPAPGTYGWKLSKKGQGDPYKAVALMFTPQSLPYRRSLLHCDYLLSLVNMLSLADAIGPADFNGRVKSFGADQFVLRWDTFFDLHVVTQVRSDKGEWLEVPEVGKVTKLGLHSTQRVRPSSEADLIVGDHVVFFNHIAYDLINRVVGNAWRLENTILVKRGSKGDPKADVFLGHGSGRNTAEQLRDVLATEFKKVWSLADVQIKRAKSSDKRTQADAMSQLWRKFSINEVGSNFRIQGMACGRMFNEPFDKFEKISGKDVVGPREPCIPSLMHEVERPIESGK